MKSYLIILKLRSFAVKKIFSFSYLRLKVSFRFEGCNVKLAHFHPEVAIYHTNKCLKILKILFKGGKSLEITALSYEVS